VLHRGRILAQGPVARVVADASAANIGGAFAALIQQAGAPREAA
jgi:hypothetical protein